MIPQDIPYCILDPTGNITALVEGGVAVAAQPSVAARIMRLHPEVEQVGFIDMKDTAADSSADSSEDTAEDGHRSAGVHASLRMAGGEFCGNASLCAAALYLLRKNSKQPGQHCAPETVVLRVSGAAQPVEVRLQAQPDGSFYAGIRMPQARQITETTLSFDGILEKAPLVRMEGISHIIIESTSPFYKLKNAPADAARAVKTWCETLSAEGLGLMFLEQNTSASQYVLTPLVYIPGSGTVFWENSCASGSSAAGMYLAAKTGLATDISFREPGGILRVTSDPSRGETQLYGSVRLRSRHGGGAAGNQGAVL